MGETTHGQHEDPDGNAETEMDDSARAHRGAETTTAEECCDGPDWGWRGKNWSGSAWGQPIADIGDMVGDLVEAVRGSTQRGGRYPALDIAEGENEFLVFVDVPGYARSDIEIKVDGSQLTILGKRDRPAALAEKSTRRAERTFGSFRRSVSVPANVDAEAIAAKLAEGILTITLPHKRKAEAGKGRTIDIE